MNNIVAIYDKLEHLEREMQHIKSILLRLIERVEPARNGTEAMQARKELTELMQTVSERIHVAPEEADRLAREAVEETRAHNPTL